MRRLLLLCCLLLTLSRVQAGPAAVTRSWQTEDGLPSNKVTAIAQTPDGYLWVGTDGGLSRFDGTRFVRYGIQEGIPPGAVQQLLADREGCLWIVIAGSRVFSLRGGVIRAFNGVAGLANRLTQLLPGSDGAVRNDLADGQLTTEAPQLPGANRPPSKLLTLRDGTLWARSPGSGLWMRKNGQWSQPSNMPENLAKNPGVMTEAVDGAFWAGSDERQIWRYDGSEWRNFLVRDAPASSYLQALAITPNGTAWAAFAGSGLWRLEGNEFVRVPLVEQGFEPTIEVLSIDRDGQLWVGTLQDGLLRVSDARVEVGRISAAEGGGIVRAMLEMAPGEFIVGLMHHGAYRWKEGHSEPLSTDPELARYIFCNALLRARDGSVWLGLGNGLHQYRDGHRVTDAAFSAQFERDSVRALCESRDGTLWVGTQSGKLCRVHDGKVEQVQGAGGAYIWALAQTPDDAIWVAMRGRGVQRVSNDHVQSFGTADGLGSDIAAALHVDSRGKLWVGLEGGGLALWQGNRFASISAANGLPEDTVVQILDDGAGRLWLAGNQGIAGIEHAELDAVLSGRERVVHPSLIGRADGMLTTQCWPMVAIKTSDGQLCFGTTRGFVRFHPPSRTSTRPPPEPIIEEIQIDGATKALPAAAPTIELAPEMESVEFRYTGLDVNHAERIRFRHRLIGLDKDWVEAGQRRFASYAHLPPGGYRFEVQASTRLREWSPIAATLPLVVHPHFWQTGWFASLCAIAMALTVGSVVRGIERRRIAQQLAALERQHAVDAERARIARDLHDDLGGSLTEMAMLSELTQASFADPERARSHLDRIFTSARDSARALDEIVWAADPGQDQLASFVAYVSEFAQTFAASTGLRCRLDLPSDLPELALSAPVRHHLFLAVKEALNNVVKHACAQEVRLRVTIGDAILCLAVSDDGRGFDTAQAAAAGSDGLANMERRLAEIRGTCSLQSSPTAGTTAEFSVPLRQLTR